MKAKKKRVLVVVVALAVLATALGIWAAAAWEEGTTMISEDAAIAKALEALRQNENTSKSKLMEDQVTCELIVSQGIYQYEIKVWVDHGMGPEFDIYYIVQLDAYTGEVLGIGMTA